MPQRTWRQQANRMTFLVAVALAASMTVPAVSAYSDYQLQLGTMQWAPPEVGQPVYAYAYLSPFEYGYAHEGWIDFGDGSDPVPISNSGRESPRVAMHVYEAGGDYTISGYMEFNGRCQPRYCHPGGPMAGQGAAHQIFISIDGGNAAPSVDAGQDMHRLPSRSFVEIAAAISDPDAGDSHSAFIDWGDGAVEPLHVDGLQAFGGHDYEGIGEWTATVCVRDAAGEEACDEVQILIAGAHGKPSPEMHPGAGKAKGLAK